MFCPWRGVAPAVLTSTVIPLAPEDIAEGVQGGDTEQWPENI